MKYEIKNYYTGVTILADEATSFSALILAAVKVKTDLRGAYLQGAYLQGADLRCADLRGADLRDAYLQGAYLQGADLRADLRGADLRGAYLRGAYLRGAYLQGADLRADLRGALGLTDLVLAKLNIVPEHGAFTGWKKCRNNVLVRVLIPEDAKRSNGMERKCRASHVQVLEVIGATEGISQHDGITLYRVGETVTCDKWDEDRFNVCSGGIHFFITKAEAIHY